MKLVRLLTFIKIIRLAKILETAKELKKTPINIDITSLTLADIVISKRRGHIIKKINKSLKKWKTRGSFTTNTRVTRILIKDKNDEKRNDDYLSPLGSPETQLIYPLKNQPSRNAATLKNQIQKLMSLYSTLILILIMKMSKIMCIFV